MPVFFDSRCCVIRCDHCPAEFVGVNRSIVETADAAKLKKGWVERKTDGETQHFCPFCADFVVGAA